MKHVKGIKTYELLILVIKYGATMYSIRAIVNGIEIICMVIDSY